VRKATPHTRLIYRHCPRKHHFHGFPIKALTQLVQTLLTVLGSGSQRLLLGSLQPRCYALTSALTVAQVFLEPEGRDTPELYVQGFSTGLPERLQLALLRTLPGAVLLLSCCHSLQAFINVTLFGMRRSGLTSASSRSGAAAEPLTHKTLL